MAIGNCMICIFPASDFYLSVCAFNKYSLITYYVPCPVLIIQELHVVKYLSGGNEEKKWNSRLDRATGSKLARNERKALIWVLERSSVTGKSMDGSLVPGQRRWKFCSLEQWLDWGITGWNRVPWKRAKLQECAEWKKISQKRQTWGSTDMGGGDRRMTSQPKR